MKIPTFEEWAKDLFKHRIYNALKDLSNEYAGIPEEIQKKAIEEAVEFFIIEFYEEGQK